MKNYLFISILIVLNSLNAQTWFQGGAGSGVSQNLYSPCDTSVAASPFHADNSGFGGANYSFAYYCSSIYLGESASGSNLSWVECAIALPIELLYFDATKVDNEVKLSWETVSEINNDYFEIERSEDGQNWEFIKGIDGAGNSNSPISYNIMDVSPMRGVSYYRLKQVDFDGEFSYSEIRSVLFENTSYQLQIYPNPTNNSVFVTGNKQLLKSIKIYNSIGKQVTSRIRIINISEQKVVLDLTNLVSGTYIVMANEIKTIVVKY